MAAGATAKVPPRALAGWHNVFYIRDEEDNFRLYPRGRLHYDLHGFFGPGVQDVSAADGGTGLKTRLFARRLRFELAGELLHAVDFLLGVDFGQPIANANGKTQSSASSGGQAPTADTQRWAAVQAPSASAQIANAWVNVRAGKSLNFMIGQEKAPFSLENRTSNNTHRWMERKLPIRAFVFPSGKEIGVTIWGDVGKEKWLAYEGGIFAGDGQNRPQVDNRFDLLGRVWAKPLAAVEAPLGKLQVGVSAKHGERDPDYVGYSYPQITTGQGFVLWDPRYRDSFGRTVMVLPSGSQDAIGGELRVPFAIFDFSAEAYWVRNQTREAIDGFQLTNTERFGSVQGLGWYAELAAWVVGDAFVSGDPGLVRPTRLDFDKPIDRKEGLELFATIGGIRASYDGASREGDHDEKTPGAPGVASDIRVLQYGIGASYWHTRAFKLSLNYLAYSTPGSLSEDNLAVVPGNLGKNPDRAAHVLHELGARVHVAF